MNIGFPTIDGHFWIERDGKIVDIEFKEYDFIKSIHNLAAIKRQTPDGYD